MRLFSIALVMLLTLLFAGMIAAAELMTKRGDQPLQIKSNELLTDSNSRTAIFSGKVIARQGDMTIYADRLKITYAAKERDVELVEANGNVRIIQGINRGESSHAIYDNRKGTITLDGAPKVYQGENELTGSVITYYVDEQKSVVSGSKGERVQATIQTGRKGVPGGKP